MSEYLLPFRPAVARLDGCGFSRLTRSLARPFDPAFGAAMVKLASDLMERSGAIVGYTQSDEITLVFDVQNPTNTYFGGRVMKLQSTLAGFASARFTRADIPNLGYDRVFDCRVESVEDWLAAESAVTDRERDCHRNAVQRAARAHMSHRETINRSCSDLIDILSDRGVDYYALPSEFRQGVCLRRTEIVSTIRAEDLESLPALHNARKNVGLTMKRSVIAPGPLVSIAGISVGTDTEATS